MSEPTEDRAAPADDSAEPAKAAEAPAPVSAPPDPAPPAAAGAPVTDDVAVPTPYVPPPAPELTPAEIEALRHRPTYVFFGTVAALSLFADIGSKAWAEVVLSKRTMMDPSIT